MFSYLFNRSKSNPDQYSGETFVKEKIVVGKVDIEMHIHRSDSRQVLIIYPGADGGIDGYNLKYRKIANWLANESVANVVRIDNLYCLDFLPYVEMMILKLSYVIDHVLENSERLFGHQEIELCVAGISAGAGACATILADYPFIKKVLLIAPYISVGRKNIERGLKRYQGKLYFIAGLEDQIFTHELAKEFHFISVTAEKFIHLVPTCDHQFKGRKNGLILSSAFKWAFLDGAKKPSWWRGILLY
jgi:hypothetical protein